MKAVPFLLTVGSLVATFIYVDTFSVPGCPFGLRSYGNQCYKIMHVKSTWSEAKVLCETMGAHLVEINDPMKEHFLFYTLINVESPLSGTPLWIGASDMMTENNWVWMKSKRHMTYRNWKMRRPEALRKGHGQCLALQALPDFEWKEIECSEHHGFVCEFDTEL